MPVRFEFIGSRPASFAIAIALCAFTVSGCGRNKQDRAMAPPESSESTVTGEWDESPSAWEEPTVFDEPPMEVGVPQAAVPPARASVSVRSDDYVEPRVSRPPDPRPSGMATPAPAPSAAAAPTFAPDRSVNSARSTIRQPATIPQPAGNARELRLPRAMVSDERSSPAAVADHGLSEDFYANDSAAAVAMTPRSAAPNNAGDSIQPPLIDGRSPALPAAERRLPAGGRATDQGFASIQVYYATDRQRGEMRLSDYEVSGKKHAFVALAGASFLLILFAALSAIRGRTGVVLPAVVMGILSGCLSAVVVLLGQANIEKHGVTYSADRGTLTRGICEVTVPDSHQRGLVERPSLLRFEIRESQRDHVVLTSAVELSDRDFKTRLAETVASCPARDVLVFIHGYNVSFDAAVRRTAQIAVDLPFEGVPVCYSWPSQGNLLGYSIDENNAGWTVAHLKQFLLELAQESGADSINVLAHSMGNRAMTAAMQQIAWQMGEQSETPFDRVVLAAPDVDADHFRRDLAPSLLRVANQITLYASSDDQALVASKKVHGYPRAGESGEHLVVVPGIETVDVSGIDLSLLGHSYYGDNESMLRDLYEVVRARLPASQRGMLISHRLGPLVYWKLAQRQEAAAFR